MSPVEGDVSSEVRVFLNGACIEYFAQVYNMILYVIYGMIRCRLVPRPLSGLHKKGPGPGHKLEGAVG